jgi:hypothetical protein
VDRGVAPNDGSGELRVSHNARPSIVLTLSQYAGWGAISHQVHDFPGTVTRDRSNQPQGTPCFR